MGNDTVFCLGFIAGVVAVMLSVLSVWIMPNDRPFGLPDTPQENIPMPKCKPPKE